MEYKKLLISITYKLASSKLSLQEPTYSTILTTIAKMSRIFFFEREGREGEKY
jgi:hypothetical protein